jgi:hypothetical protein
MASEVSGLTGKFFYDSVEQAVKKADIDMSFNMADSTSTATNPLSTESIALRATRTIKVDALLYDAFGTEIVTGTLTLGKKYLVTASASTFDGKWAVGSLFTSDGTETATGTEKVKLHGDEITGGSLALSIAGTFKDSSSTEEIALRSVATSKIDCIMYRDTADKVTNSTPTATALVLTFKTGTTITGTGVFKQMSITDDINGIVKVSYQIDWVGLPVEVNCGFLEMGVSNSCQRIYETGTSTNKEITGNAIFTEKTITADVNSEVKISYSGTFVGAITPSVYS